MQNYYVELAADTGIVGFAARPRRVRGRPRARARQAFRSSFSGLIAVVLDPRRRRNLERDRDRRRHPARRAHLDRARARCGRDPGRCHRADPREPAARRGRLGLLVRRVNRKSRRRARRADSPLRRSSGSPAGRSRSSSCSCSSWWRSCPGVTSGTATVNIADLAILAVTVAALVRLSREGVGALRASLWLWGTSLALLLVHRRSRALYPTFSDPDYAWKTHFATALKFAEFFVLAPGDRRAAPRRAGRSVASTRWWSCSPSSPRESRSCSSSGVHMLPRLGHRGTASRRSPASPTSGTVGAAALALGFLGELWPGSVSRRTTIGALVGGALAVVLSGQAAAGLGVGAAMIASLLLVRARRKLELRRVARRGRRDRGVRARADRAARRRHHSVRAARSGS